MTCSKALNGRHSHSQISLAEAVVALRPTPPNGHPASGGQHSFSNGIMAT